MPTSWISTLFVYWYLVWGIFNIYLLPRNISLIKGGRKSTIFFSLASILPLTLIAYTLNANFVSLILIQLFLVGIPFKPLQLERNLLSDIIFQQSMLYLLFTALTQNETILHFLFFIAGILISHLPIFFLKHVNIRGKLIIMIALPIAATFIYFAFRNLTSTTSLLISLLIHFGFYFALLNIPETSSTGIII